MTQTNIPQLPKPNPTSHLLCRKTINDLLHACSDFLQLGSDVSPRSDDDPKFFNSYYSKLALVNDCCRKVGMTIEFSMAVLNVPSESEEA